MAQFLSALTVVQIISSINDHVSLSLFQVGLSSQSKFLGQEPGNGERLTQDLAVKFKNWKLAHGHVCKLKNSPTNISFLLITFYYQIQARLDFSNNKY